MSKICVVIPMYGFNEMTKSCIDYVIKNAGIECDILVVDDGSPIPYVDDRVIIKRLEKNSGFTNATNQGLLYCLDKYDYVLTLNNDTEPEKDFLKILYDFMEEHKDVGLASSARWTYRDGKLANVENFGIDLLRGWMACTPDDIANGPLYVAWVPINSSLISTETLKYVGLLDKRMINYCSDNDLCLRLHMLGYRICLVPQSRVKHFHQVTTTHNKIKSDKDQEILLSKISSAVYRGLLNDYPLDTGENTWGKLTFEVYTKDDNVKKSS